MSSNLWKKIGIKKNSSSDQNFSEGSTVNLVRCLDNLKHYTQTQEIGAYSSDPIKISSKSIGNSSRNNDFINKDNNEDLLIEYCESESAHSDKNNRKQISIEKLKKNLIHLNQFMKSLRAQYQNIRQAIPKQMAKLKGSLLQQTFTEISHKMKTIAVNFERNRSDVAKDEQKCVKCKNSQKLVEILTKQCWTLEEQIKQIRKNQKNGIQECNKAQYERKEQQKDDLIQNMEQTASKLQKQKATLSKELAIKDAKIGELQARNIEILTYFKGQIEQLKQYAEQKIEQLNSKNRTLQTKLQFMDEKYNHLHSKYQVVKQLNMSMEIDKKSVEHSHKLYKSSKFLSLGDSNKKYSSQIDAESIIEGETPRRKSRTKIKPPAKYSFPIYHVQSPIHRDLSFHEDSPGVQDAFQKLDQLQRQVQRKIKMSRLKAK